MIKCKIKDSEDKMSNNKRLHEIKAYTLVTRKQPTKIARQRSQSKIIKKKIKILNIFGKTVNNPNGSIKITLKLTKNQLNNIKNNKIAFTFITKFTNCKNNFMPSVIGVNIPKKHKLGPLRI